MDRYSQIYCEKADENFELFKFLHENDKFISWQIIAIFYSALCLAKAYLYNKNIPKNSINSHTNIKYLLTTETEAKNLNVIYYYEKLYNDSRDARYSTKRITNERIKNALENYNKIKTYLRIS